MIKESIFFKNFFINSRIYKQNIKRTKNIFNTFKKDFERMVLRFVIVSRVSPDFETTIKHEFFKFFIFLYSEIKF